MGKGLGLLVKLKVITEKRYFQCVDFFGSYGGKFRDWGWGVTDLNEVVREGSDDCNGIDSTCPKITKALL